MLPYFFQKEIPLQKANLILEEATSKHCIQVLRMDADDRLLLTDGKGIKATAKILNPNKKKCVVELLEIKKSNPRTMKLSMGVCFTKNRNRNEWFLEKATEIGIDYIFPIIARRSEREQFNEERNQQILISAMLQSQQCFLPEIMKAQKISQFLKHQPQANTQKFIAHCEEDNQKKSFLDQLHQEQNALILIGPEGDFTESEIKECLDAHFIPITLGPNRLRTETAALFACTVFNTFHYGS